MIARLKDVCQAYFKGERQSILKALVLNKLLSSTGSAEISKSDTEDILDNLFDD